MSEFLIGYILGLVVALTIVIIQHEPMTVSTIKQAEAACVDNKGLKEINGSRFSCINGAVFEKGEGK